MRTCYDKVNSNLADLTKIPEGTMTSQRARLDQETFDNLLDQGFSLEAARYLVKTMHEDAPVHIKTVRRTCPVSKPRPTMRRRSLYLGQLHKTILRNRLQ